MMRRKRPAGCGVLAAGLLLTGLHVALHWQWIVNMTKRFILAPLSARSAPQLSVGASPELKLNAQPVRKEI